MARAGAGLLLLVLAALAYFVAHDHPLAGRMRAHGSGDSVQVAPGADSRGAGNRVEALLTSFAVVALAEMGDKTQLLAFSLAARYRQPWTVMLGILIATVFNHAIAASVGAAVAAWLGPTVLAVVLGVSFLAFGAWTLVPDTLDEDEKPSRWGPLVTTIVLFFLAEIGDKTQLATVALGARFASAAWVTAGTTLGMLVADGLAVAVGHQLRERLPMKALRFAAAALFFALGVITLVGAFWSRSP